MPLNINSSIIKKLLPSNLERKNLIIITIKKVSKALVLRDNFFNKRFNIKKNKKALSKLPNNVPKI
jgi:hypothetical protein